ncbi:MAG: signal recognition particle-docking protein FtsY, partial [Pseudomonadota bacterium]
LESALAAAWPGRAVDRLAVPADKAGQPAPSAPAPDPVAAAPQTPEEATHHAVADEPPAEKKKSWLARLFG